MPLDLPSLANCATPSGGGGTSDHSAVTSVGVSRAQPVYLKTNGEWDLARSDALPATRAIGLALADVAATFALIVRARGRIDLTTAVWDAVTGDVGGLTPSARYYVSGAVAGQLVKVPPASGFVVKVGRAINSTTMDLELQRRIKL